MKKKTEIMVKIQSLLKDLSVPEQIEILERLGKRTRQANSIQTAKEVEGFRIKAGVKRPQIDDYPT